MDNKQEVAEVEREEQSNPAEATSAASGKTDAPNAGEELLTKEQFERAFRKRLERERQQLEEKLTKKYGDYDDLKKAAAELQKIKDSQKTEQEKMLEQFEKLQQRLADIQSENARLEQERQEAMLRAAVTAKATSLGFIDPMDAYRAIDLAELKLGDDGTIEGLEEQLKALSESKPYLLRTPPQQPRVSVAAPGHQAGSGQETDAQRRQRLFGLKPSPFGTAQGGGLFIPGEE